MWKQQDSLEGPAATAAETIPEDNLKDSNPLLERLRALEVNRVGFGSKRPAVLVLILIIWAIDGAQSS